jgi:hypothetical protein
VGFAASLDPGVVETGAETMEIPQSDCRASSLITLPNFGSGVVAAARRAAPIGVAVKEKR